MTLKDKATMGPLDKFVKYSNTLHRFIPMEIASSRHSVGCLHYASCHNC